MTVGRSFYTSDAFTEHYLGIRWPARLWAAVLENAINDAVKGPHAAELKGMLPEEALRFERDVRAAANDWIADEMNEPRRFVWVCEVLNLDPAAVRRQVQERRDA